MADLRTSIAIPTLPWEAAKTRFLEGLPQEQHDVFANTTSENIFYSTSVAVSQYEQKSQTRRLQKKLQPLATALDEYGKAIDVITNSASMYLCPLWGCIRVVLQVSAILLASW